MLPNFIEDCNRLLSGSFSEMHGVLSTLQTSLNNACMGTAYE